MDERSERRDGAVLHGLGAEAEGSAVCWCTMLVCYMCIELGEMPSPLLFALYQRHATNFQISQLVETRNQLQTHDCK